MTNEEKQALIWRCRDAVAHLKHVVEVGVRGGRYSVTEYRYQLMVNEIALAALTAQPVACKKKRLVNHRTGAEYNWTYHGKVEEETSGDNFRVEVVPLFTNPTDYEVLD